MSAVFLNLDNIFFVLSKFLTFSSMYMVSTNLIHHYHSHSSKILILYQPSKIYLFFSTDCMNKILFQLLRRLCN